MDFQILSSLDSAAEFCSRVTINDTATLNRVDTLLCEIILYFVYRQWTTSRFLRPIRCPYALPTLTCYVAPPMRLITTFVAYITFRAEFSVEFPVICWCVCVCACARLTLQVCRTSRRVRRRLTSASSASR